MERIAGIMSVCLMVLRIHFMIPSPPSVRFRAFLHADDALCLLAVFFDAFTPHRMLLIAVHRFVSFCSSSHLSNSQYMSNEMALTGWNFIRHMQPAHTSEAVFA